VLKVAVTGIYGAGKSTVLGLLRQLGAPTISTDELVEQCLREPQVQRRLRELFGPEVFGPGGELLKERLARKVFSDPRARRTLEDLLHPLVFERLRERYRALQAPVVFVEVPLLFERGYEGRFDRVLTVHVPQETALRRLEASGVPRAEALRRLRAQMPPEEKARRAHYVVDNSRDLEHTLRQLRRIYKELTGG